MNNATIASNIKDAVNLVIEGVDKLCAAFEHIEDVDFYRIHTDFERFEESLHRKTLLDAAFAFMAERDDAGRLVGSSRSTDYLTKCLGLTHAEAAMRLTAGNSLYGKITPDPVPDPEPVEQEPIAEPDEGLSEEEKSGNAKKRKRKRNAKRKRLRTQLDASTKRPKRKLNAALSVNAKPKKNDAERWLKRQRAQRLPKLLSKSFAI